MNTPTAETVHREGKSESAAAKGFVKGSIGGFTVVGLIGFGIAMNAGADVLPAIGVACFAGVWGGPGFGGMIGATLAATRHDEAELEASRIHIT